MLPFDISLISHISLTLAGHAVNGYPYRTVAQISIVLPIWNISASQSIGKYYDRCASAEWKPLIGEEFKGYSQSLYRTGLGSSLLLLTTKNTENYEACPERSRTGKTIINNHLISPLSSLLDRVTASIIEQSGYVFSGKFRLKFGDVDEMLEPGDTYSIPGNTPHSFEIIETGQVVDFFSPPREDYL